jgi:hypothetical protein
MSTEVEGKGELHDNPPRRKATSADAASSGFRPEQPRAHNPTQSNGTEENHRAVDLQTRWPKHLQRDGGATIPQEPPTTLPIESAGQISA